MTHYDAFSSRDPNLNPGLNCKVRHMRHATGRPTLPVDAIRATCVDALMSLYQERINGENIESKASGQRWFRDQWGMFAGLSWRDQGSKLPSFSATIGLHFATV